MIQSNNTNISGLVSIIIPNFNRENLIDATLDSILAQSYSNWECIVVDDHSTDNSEEVIKKYCDKDQRIKYYRRPDSRQKGQCACRNYGYEQSRGEYINWFDSDDLMHKDFILNKYMILEEQLKLDAVISKSVYFNDGNKDILFKEERTFLSENTLEDFLLFNITWYLPDPMWRRNFLDGKMLFNEKLFSGGVDREFHTRMLLEHPHLMIADEYLTYCRKHNQNISTEFYTSKQNIFKQMHLESTIRLISLLEKNDVLSNEIRIKYFNIACKYLPYVYSDKEQFKKLTTLLKKLSFNDKDIRINWMKFYTAYLSFLVFKKGSLFLK